MHRYYIYILTIILLLLGVINTANADGNTANADGNTILVATHTFWFRGGKGGYNKDFVKEQFSGSYARDIKSFDVVSSEVKCLYQYDLAPTWVITYSAKIRGSTTNAIVSAMSNTNTYFPQFKITVGQNFKPIVLPAPQEPLTFPRQKTCSDGQLVTDAEAVQEKEKVSKYVFNGITEKPDTANGNTITEEEWDQHLESCISGTNPTIDTYTHAVMPPEANAIINLVGLGIGALGYLAYLIYQKIYGIKLDKDDEDLQRSIQVKKDIKEAKKKLKGVGPTEGNELDKKIKDLTKELKQCEENMKAKLKILTDEAIAKADKKRAEAKKAKEEAAKKSKVQKAIKKGKEIKAKVDAGKESIDAAKESIDATGIDIETGTIDTEKTEDFLKDGAEKAGLKLAENVVGKENVKKAKMLKNNVLKTVSQVLTVVSGLLSIISAIILMNNYLSGTLSILDVKMRLDGYKFANDEKIDVVPLPFACGECDYTFTPTAEILEIIETKITRNGTREDTEKITRIDDPTETRSVAINYQTERNDFIMKSTWVALPKELDAYKFDPSHTACVIRGSNDLELNMVLAFFAMFTLGVTFIEVVAEFDNGIFKRIKDALGMSKEISIMHGKYKFTIQKVIKKASPIFLSLPLNFLLANLQDVGASLHVRGKIGIYLAKSDKAPFIISIIVQIATVLIVIGVGYLLKVMYNMKVCLCIRKCFTNISRCMNSLKRKKAGKKSSFYARFKEKLYGFFIWAFVWMIKIAVVLQIFLFYAIILIETFDGNIGFGAIFFSVDFPIIAPAINLPSVYMNLAFQSINKIRLGLAIGIAFTAQGLEAGKLANSFDVEAGKGDEEDKNENGDDEEGESGGDDEEGESGGDGEEGNPDTEESDGEQTLVDEATANVEDMQEKVEENIEEEDEESNDDKDKKKKKGDKSSISKENEKKKEIEMSEQQSGISEDLSIPKQSETPVKSPSSNDFSVPRSRRRSRRKSLKSKK